HLYHLLALNYCTTMLLHAFISSLFFYPHIAFSTSDLRFQNCGSTNNYTTNSIFSTNLFQALDNLSKYTALTGYNATTTGNLTGESVTALALCRGGLAPSGCQNCITDALSGIQAACPNQTAAQVWFDNCTIRYSGKKFLNKVDDSVIVNFGDWRLGPDPDSFKESALLLVQTLSSQAAVAEKKYSVGRTNITHNLMLYGYVDCTRDLDNTGCTKCVLTAIDAIKLSCLSKWFCWILTPSCNVQFNVDPVHQDWPNAPFVSSFMLMAPPPATLTVNSTRGGRGKGLKIKVSVGVVTTVILAVGILVMKARKRGMRMDPKSRGNEIEEAEELMKRGGVGMRKFMYDLHQLVVATDNFSTSNRLGRGGFGIVYKVILIFFLPDTI
ncbi:unnamed protein product, partial [Ilex paraguariensis]